MRARHLLLPSLALGGAALLVGPAPVSEGFSLLGDSLELGQRDFRIHNNFSKAITNDNLDPDDNFPGAQGAVMAIWKGCVEWGSGLHGSGNGDPTQPGGLGTGGANFDPAFMGEASNVGTSTQNIHSQISGGSGGVLAFAEGGLFSSAWRIRYYEVWDWEDGPGSPSFGETDLQGVACHEYGHALGLGHSSVGGTTMFATVSGTGAGQRSIEPDDQAGVKAIYGAKSASKPRIESIDVSGGALTIHGEGFSGSGNEVWFTNQNVTSGGTNPFVKVTGVASTSGGTVISVGIPPAAGPGDVLVRKNGSSFASLSNAWPFDPTGNPPAPVVTGIDPSSAPAVNEDPVLVTLTGNGLETVQDVRFDGQPVDYTLTVDHDLTFTLPDADVGQKTVEVETLYGTGSTPFDVVVNDPPALITSTPLIFAGQAAELTVGAEPGATAFVAVSTSQLPSVLPGVIAADIGNGFLDLTLVAAPVVDASGSVDVSVLTGGLPAFTTLYFQAAEFDAQGTLPMPVSQVVDVIVI